MKFVLFIRLGKNTRVILNTIFAPKKNKFDKKVLFTSYNKENLFYSLVINFLLVKQVTSNIKASRNFFCDTCDLPCTCK